MSAALQAVQPGAAVDRAPTGDAGDLAAARRTARVPRFGVAIMDNEKEMSRLTGIVDSMTPEERRNPKVIDSSRKNRIAKGCGVNPNQVSDLIKQFEMIGPMLQIATSGSMADKMKMLQQMQGMMANNPFNPTAGMKLKGNTGKRLSPKEKEKLQKERERLLRKKKRN